MSRLDWRPRPEYNANEVTDHHYVVMPNGAELAVWRWREFDLDGEPWPHAGKWDWAIWNADTDLFEDDNVLLGAADKDALHDAQIAAEQRFAELFPLVSQRD
jgi:hypothetical protein